MTQILPCVPQHDLRRRAGTLSTGLQNCSCCDCLQYEFLATLDLNLTEYVVRLPMQKTLYGIFDDE